MDRDSESTMWEFHEHYPKDKIHAELLSLRDPLVLASRTLQHYREFGINTCFPSLSIFDGLDSRMLWPQASRYSWRFNGGYKQGFSQID